MNNHKLVLSRLLAVFLFLGFTSTILSSTLLTDRWKSSTNWNKIIGGMSTSQVTEILGLPSSYGTGGMGPVWYYKGNVPGSGKVTGYIQFYRERVWEIEPPVFATPKTSTTQPISDRWKSSTNWNKIIGGMSTSQVTEILGLPSSYGTGGMGPVWYYKGNVPGSGKVTGYIQFYRERVWEIEPPVFATPKTSTTQPISDRWKSSTNWNKIIGGMSTSQVTEILGLPSSYGTGGMGPVWYYKGNVPGSGKVTGYIQFYRERVWEIEPPVF